MSWANVFVVARREFTERLRDKAFAVSAATTMLVIVGIVVLPALFGGDGPTEHTVGAVGADGVAVAQAAADAAPDTEMAITVKELPDRAAAEQALRAEEIPVAVIGGRELLALSDPDPALAAALDAAAIHERRQAAIAEAGLDEQQAAAIVAPEGLTTTSLDGSSDSDASEALAFLAVFVVYGQLFGYGFWVAMGVVEEKSTRIVEVLLAAISPRELLAGKILGIGVLGLLQLLGTVFVGVGAALLTRDAGLPEGAAATIGITLLWFLLGYAFYSTAFAVAGALVSRQEDLQNAMTPLTLLILTAFLLSFQALNAPDSTLARITQFLPPTAPMIMPVRVALGEATRLEIAIAVAVTAAGAALLVPIAARIYSGAVLRIGAKVKLRDALRSTSRPAA